MPDFEYLINDVPDVIDMDSTYSDDTLPLLSDIDETDTELEQMMIRNSDDDITDGRDTSPSPSPIGPYRMAWGDDALTYSPRRTPPIGYYDADGNYVTHYLSYQTQAAIWQFLADTSDYN